MAELKEEIVSVPELVNLFAIVGYHLSFYHSSIYLCLSAIMFPSFLYVH